MRRFCCRACDHEDTEEVFLQRESDHSCPECGSLDLIEIVDDETRSNGPGWARSGTRE